MDQEQNRKGKLVVDSSYFLERGYERVNVTMILREKVDSIHFWSNNGKIKFPRELVTFTPIGNPPAFFVGFAENEDKVYVSLFFSKDIALHLSLFGSSKEAENIGLLLRDIRLSIQEYLENKLSGEENELVFKEQEHQFRTPLLLRIKQIEGVLFSFLTHRRILVIGSVEEIEQVVFELMSILPNAYRNQYGFTLDLPPIDTESITLYCVTPKFFVKYKEEFEKFQETSGQELDIINVEEKQAISDYDSEIIKQFIEQALQKDQVKQLVSIKEAVGELFSMASEIRKEDNIADIVERLQVPYDYAELVHDIAIAIRRR